MGHLQLVENNKESIQRISSSVEDICKTCIEQIYW